jgi:hypothetical protein
MTVVRKGDSLTLEHGDFSTSVDVLGPEKSRPGEHPIKAVVQVRSHLPSQLAAMIPNPEMTVGMNSLAALGAVTVDENGAYVGSRLTMYEGEEAWDVKLPLLLFAATTGAASLLGAMRQAVSGEKVKRAASAWKKGDFAELDSLLSRRCVCTADSSGLTAEFGLDDQATSAVMGDHDTALWRIRNDQPHPELGGGLFCLLELPQRLPDAAALDRALVELNRREMAPEDLPPHFGAWTRGRFDNNPAYVSFLPNILHKAPGIALHVSVWAHFRARWASGVLASRGVRA